MKFFVSALFCIALSPSVLGKATLCTRIKTAFYKPRIPSHGYAFRKSIPPPPTVGETNQFIMDYARAKFRNHTNFLNALEEKLQTLPRPLGIEEGKFIVDILKRVKRKDRPLAMRYFHELVRINDTNLYALASSHLRQFESVSHQEFLEHARRKLDPRSFSIFEKALPSLPEYLEKRLSTRFIKFVNTLNEVNRHNALGSLKELVAQSPKNPHIKSFLSQEERLLKGEIRYFVDSYRHLETTREARSGILGLQEYPLDIGETALRQTNIFMAIRRSTALQCAAQKIGALKRQARRWFIGGVVGIRLITSGAAMGLSNRSQPFSYWGQRALYDMTIRFTSSFAQAAILTSSFKTVSAIIGHRIFVQTLLDVPSAAVFSSFHDAEWTGYGKDKQSLYNETMASLRDPRRNIPPDELELLESFEQALEDEATAQNFVRSFISVVGSSLGWLMEEEDSLRIEGVDWANLTQEDLENELVQGAVMGVVAKGLYESTRGDWINMGGHGRNFYTYEATYGAAMSPLNFFLESWIFNGMCNNLATPSSAIMSALGLLFVKESVFNGLRYKGRHEAINL